MILLIESKSNVMTYSDIIIAKKEYQLILKSKSLKKIATNKYDGQLNLSGKSVFNLFRYLKKISLCSMQFFQMTNF